MSKDKSDVCIELMGEIGRRLPTTTIRLVLESNARARRDISIEDHHLNLLTILLGSIPSPPPSTHIETEMHNSFSTDQLVAQLEGSPPRGVDEEASRERRACGKRGRCGSPQKDQTGRCSSKWSLAREKGAPQPLPSPKGAPLKTGYHHIRSLGGRGRTVRKVEKDGVHPQPLFVEYVDKRSSGGESGELLTDGPGWAVSEIGEDGEIGLRLLGGNPCVVKLDDGKEFIGLDDFGQYSSPEIRWKLAEASGDFKYQNSSGEALRVYRIVNAAQPTHGWIYKQYEGADMIGYGNVYSPQTGYTDPEYVRKAERLGLFHFGSD